MVQTFNTVRRIISGYGCLETLGDEIKRLKGSKVLVITDSGIKAAGLVDLVAKILDRARVPYRFFTEVEPDPKIEVVASSLEAAKSFGPNVIIGFGGGSSLDISKVTSVMLTNAGSIKNILAWNSFLTPGSP